MKLSLLFISICSLGCANIAEIHNANSLPQETMVRVDLHGDVSFDAHERQIIQKAADTWYDYSNHYAKFNIRYDLNFDDMQSLKDNLNRNVLLRSDSTMNIASMADKHVNGRVLSFVSHNPDFKFGPQRLYIIRDRIKSDEDFYQLALHELGHLLWVKHVDDSHSVMYVEHNKESSCLTKEDMKAFCQANGCNLEQMKWCER